jgi:DNA primase
MPTKHDIAEYYSDPDVQREILKSIGNRPVLAVQTHADDKKVYRRNDPRGGSIRIKTPDDLQWFTDRRYSEFHPSIGKNTFRFLVLKK